MCIPVRDSGSGDTATKSLREHRVYRQRARDIRGFANSWTSNELTEIRLLCGSRDPATRKRRPLSDRIRALQILRFVAASMVAWVHACPAAFHLVGNPWNGPHSEFGSNGVDIFFVLSGAIIYKSAFEKGGQTPGGFFWRRFLRVAPLYYLATAIWFVVGRYSGTGGTFGIPNIVSSLTFWPALEGLTEPILQPGWSLDFEMLFYLSATLVLWRRAALGALIACFATSWLLRDMTGFAAFQILGNPVIIEFALGVLIVMLWKPKSPAPIWFAISLIAIGFAGLFFLYLPPGSSAAYWTLSGAISIPRVLFWGLPSGVILLGALMIEPHLRGNWIKALVLLGDASYSIYLVHFPVIWLCAAMMPRGITPWVTLPLFLALGIGSGVLIYFFIETPMRRALRKSRRIELAPHAT